MFKFTIRELLLMTMIVALAVGWFLDRGRLTRPIVHGQVSVNVDDYLTKLNPGESVIVSRGTDGMMSVRVVRNPSAVAPTLPDD